MKKKIILTVSATLAVILCGVGIFAFADQENNFTVPCDEHSFVLVSFSENEALARCEYCDEEIHYDFYGTGGVREGDDDFVPALDVNEDGIINGRDLVHLKTEF